MRGLGWDTLRRLFGNPITHTGKFEAFDAAESHTDDITGLSTNNPVIRQMRLYIEDDPGADANVICRLSFYNSDSMTEDELLIEFYFNLTYTEVKTNEITGTSDTSNDVDSSAGLVKYDLVRFLGGTAENQRITAITDADTIAFTLAAQTHAVDSGVVRVAEVTDVFQLYDADGTKEIHGRLEMLSDPGSAVDVVIEIDVQR